MELTFTLNDVKTAVKKWLHIQDTQVVDVVLATYIANKFNTDPLWLLIIAPPSFAKTELLRGFKDHPGAVYVSLMTPTTLISGIKPTGKMPEPSLLPKLNDKILVLKDFTTILTMRSDAQQEILSQLREVYDGRYCKAFGNGKILDWQGKVGFIAACTLAYDKHWSVSGSLGERFLLWRTNDNDTKGMARKAQSVIGGEEQMRRDIQQAVHDFINQFETIGDMHVKKDPEVNEKIISLACFVAMARTPVERDYRNQTILYQPAAEGPARLTKQLMQLGYGLAMAHGVNEITADIYGILKKVACDLVPPQRLRVVRHLVKEFATEEKSVWEKTKDIGDKINTPTRSTLLVLEDLMVAEVVKRQRGGEGADNSPYEWQLNKNITDLIQEAGIFEQEDDGFEIKDVERIPF